MAYIPMDTEVRPGLEAVVVWCDMSRVLLRIMDELQDYSEPQKAYPDRMESDVVELTRLCTAHLKLVRDLHVERN